jgi:hypothetical protein
VEPRRGAHLVLVVVLADLQETQELARVLVEILLEPALAMVAEVVGRVQGKISFGLLPLLLVVVM